MLNSPLHICRQEPQLDVIQLKLKANCLQVARCDVMYSSMKGNKLSCQGSGVHASEVKHLISVIALKNVILFVTLHNT